MSARRTVWRVGVSAAVILGLGVAGLVCQRVGARGRYAVDYSTYGGGPEGTRGLFLLAEELGARPQRWARDLGRLPEGGMLVATGSCRQRMLRDVGRIERQNLRRWVERGGVLVVAGADDYLAREDFGVELAGDDDRCTPTEGLVGMMVRAERGPRKTGVGDDADEPELEDLPGAFRDDPARTYDEVTEQEALARPRLAVGASEPLRGIPFVGLRNPLDVRVDARAAGDTLLRLDGPDGRPAAVRVDVGRGAVVAIASASLLQNRDLAEQNGGVLFARLVEAHAPEGPVLFDEYHLGVGQRRSTMRYLRQVGAGAVVVQVLLLILFGLWRFGARFGSPRPEPPPDPAGTASYVEGVGTLYAKARDPEGAARILARRALERIGAHHHLDPRDAEHLARQLEARRRVEAAEAVRAIASRADRPVGRRGLARLADELDAQVAAATRRAA
ncbi:MAG TPA: DUF4350 domain-containing protein [Sandaracinaceae bacterium LLY-WYZ-13_1]|nr:DUF4350 domain-containing protein [Sandaracinaceae bacterium LLY-WYZ-13_1]